MARRNKNQIEIKYPEIAVFALSKGSQINAEIINSQSYRHVLRIIENTMRLNNVVSDKIVLYPNATVLITKMIKDDIATAAEILTASCTPVYLTIPV